MKISRAHKYLTFETIISRKDGWKTLLPCHCKQAINKYFNLYGDSALEYMLKDYGKKITGVIVDMTNSNESDDYFLNILNIVM